jgi:hypothetical protein
MFWNPFPSKKNKLTWEATQQGFISFINFFEALHAFKRPDDTDMTANEIAAVFMKIIKVDISPYPDFETMRLCVQPEAPLEEMIMRILAIMENDLRIGNALEGTGVLLSEEEQVRLLVRNFLTNEFINDLSKFVSFRE